MTKKPRGISTDCIIEHNVETPTTIKTLNCFDCMFEVKFLI